MMGENPGLAWQRAFAAPEELSGEDLMTVYSFLDLHYDRIAFVFVLNQITELSETYEGMLQWHASNIFGANDVAHAWWSTKAELDELPMWAQYIDQFVQRGDLTPEFQVFVAKFCKSVSANQNCETP